MSKWVISWEVESKSDPGTYYTVSQDEHGNFGCSCPGWKFQRKECKHIRLMKGQLAMMRDHLGLQAGAPGVTQAQHTAVGKPLEEPGRKRRRFVFD